MLGSSFRLNWPAIKRQQIILLKSYQRDSRIGQQCRLMGGWRSPPIADFTWGKVGWRFEPGEPTSHVDWDQISGGQHVCFISASQRAPFANRSDEFSSCFEEKSHREQLFWWAQLLAVWCLRTRRGRVCHTMSHTLLAIPARLKAVSKPATAYQGSRPSRDCAPLATIRSLSREFFGARFLGLIKQSGVCA